MLRAQHRGIGGELMQIIRALQASGWQRFRVRPLFGGQAELGIAAITQALVLRLQARVLIGADLRVALFIGGGQERIVRGLRGRG
jgi:hypothetical protein